ncbi:SDR family NAD(P)-dependent oxidoreductase [Elioraea sp.]|uniref:SDR family NAD(P)-dependent oxidoreductase n=1 Tax=Elioraea sp. TaxID=2185103 RepID=UPI003F72908D
MGRPDRFTGRVGVVTGAASGLGRATAIGLATEDARLVLFDRDAGGLAETAASCPGAVRVVGDVTVSADHARVLAAAAPLGPIALHATAAGTLGPAAPLADVSEADWDRLFAVNVKGTWLAVRAVLPQMLAAGRGAIVTFASGAGLAGNPTMPAYSASKGAVVLLTRSLAVSHVGQGIRANCVCPGPIETPMLRDTFAQAGDAAAIAAREAAFRARNPMGRFGTVDEVAESVLFLLSDAASYITGVALPVDGGKLA